MTRATDNPHVQLANILPVDVIKLPKSFTTNAQGLEIM